MGEDKHAKVSLAFLRRKNRLGMMVKLLTKLISSSSKVKVQFGSCSCFVCQLLCGAERRRCFRDADKGQGLFVFLRPKFCGHPL